MALWLIFEIESSVSGWPAGFFSEATATNTNTLVVRKKEYESFNPLPGVHLNGKLTLGEHTADNGGVRLAFMALI